MNRELLSRFVPKDELDTLIENCHGEEGEFFQGKISEIENTIHSVPALYATEQEKSQRVYLHYFCGATDIYVTELDQRSGEAFGFACLNGDKENAELGYISIPELLKVRGMQLDLYFDTNTLLSEVMEKYDKHPLR